MVVNKKIAILCNYQLLVKRVGGMDHFFWQFDAKCKQNNVEVDWFFPNHSEHGDYFKLKIIESKEQNVEIFFKTNNELQNDVLTFEHRGEHSSKPREEI